MARARHASQASRPAVSRPKWRAVRRWRAACVARRQRRRTSRWRWHRRARSIGTHAEASVQRAQHTRSIARRRSANVSSSGPCRQSCAYTSRHCRQARVTRADVHSAYACWSAMRCSRLAAHASHARRSCLCADPRRVSCHVTAVCSMARHSARRVRHCPQPARRSSASCTRHARPARSRCAASLDVHRRQASRCRCACC